MFNNNKTYQIIIFFTICLGLLSSQTYSISGIVLDFETKNQIDNVNIYINNSDIGTTTNNEGYFVLYLNNQLGNSIDLNIKMIGYEEKILQFNFPKSNLDLGEIYLKNKSLELESIHVHSHKNKLSQISDISLTGQELSDNLTGNIATTLFNQPNIGINSLGTVIAKPVLRGYSGDRFLLIKDGNQMGDLSQSSIDHVITLDMTEVREIEIIRGPKSLVFGPNTIGGVINTSISANPKVRVEKFFKKFLIGGESYNKGIYGNMVLYIPVKNNQINIFLNNRYTGNQSSPNGELENSYSEVSNYKLGFTKYSRNNFISIILEKVNMDYGIPASSVGHINGVDIKLSKNSILFNYHQDISFYDFNQFDVKYNFIDYEHTEFENDFDYFSVGLSKNTNNLKIELKSSNALLGSEFNYKQFLPSGFYWTPITNQIDLSLYSYYEKEFHQLDLLGSFRTGYLLINPERENMSFSNIDNEEVINRNFIYFSSSIGIRKFINKFQINTWIMNTMRAPEIEELYSDGPHLGSYSYEIGEPNLKLEKIFGIESSIAYRANALNIALTGFYNYSPYYYQMSKMGECEDEFVVGASHPCAGADYIEWGSGPSGWLYKYQTKGIESLIKGLEFNFSYTYQGFKILYDFSLVRGDNLTSGLPLSYINPDKQTIILEYKKIVNYKLRLSKINSQNRLGEFESFTPSSFLVDFILSYSKKNQNITIQFNNILNEKYYNHLSKIKLIMPEAGRNIVLNYKIFF